MSAVGGEKKKKRRKRKNLGTWREIYRAIECLPCLAIFCLFVMSVNKHRLMRRIDWYPGRHDYAFGDNRKEVAS